MFGWGKKNKKNNKEIDISSTKQNIQCEYELKDQIKNDKRNSGFKAVYHVKLLFKNEPKLKVVEIVEELRKTCGNVQIICGNEKSDFFGVAFKDYCVKQEEDKYIPVEGVIGKIDLDSDNGSLEEIIRNSSYIDCNESILREAKYQILITDMMAAKLDYKKRLELFNNIIIAVLTYTDCIAINWELSGQIINSKTYLRKIKEDKLFGAVKIRNSLENGYNIVDTVGLATLGLPDLQCKFKDLKIEDVEKVIKNNSFLLYEFGNVIEDGQIIQGINVADKWSCNHTKSYIKPERNVINININ